MRACYRKLKNYKYQLKERYSQDIGLIGQDVDTPFIKLNSSGEITIEANYAWDGPSGPTFDTNNFMRGSLVHDALYQLIRMNQIPHSFKDQADKLLRKDCIQDGMSKFRAWYVYLAVKYFSGNAAKPGSQKPDKLYYAPKE